MLTCMGDTIRMMRGLREQSSILAKIKTMEL